MRCVSRRVADGTLLPVIKDWLTAPVIERDQRTTRGTTEAKDQHRGTPQGSPISRLLANLYFRRFLLAWERFGHREQLNAHGRQLRRRPRHLLPTRKWIGGTGDDAAANDTTRADGERSQDSIGATRSSGLSACLCGVVASWICLSRCRTAFRDGRVPI